MSRFTEGDKGSPHLKIYPMNWTALIIIGVLLAALLVFLVVRNIKDEKKFEEDMNRDYHKTKDAEGESPIDGDERL